LKNISDKGGVHMDIRLCAKCGYAMVEDIDKKTLWCPACETTEEIEKDELEKEKDNT